MSVRTCQRWCAKLIEGKDNCSDAKRNGHSSLDIDEEILRLSLELHKYVTTRQIRELRADPETIWLNVYIEWVEYFVNKWIPHRLSDANKLGRKILCEVLFVAIVLHGANSR